MSNNPFHDLNKSQSDEEARRISEQQRQAGTLTRKVEPHEVGSAERANKINNGW